MPSLPMPNRKARGAVVVLVAGALVMSLNGAVGAANPVGWNKIPACVNVKTKVVKIRTVRYSNTSWCPPGYRYFQWAVRGPVG